MTKPTNVAGLTSINMCAQYILVIAALQFYISMLYNSIRKLIISHQSI